MGSGGNKKWLMAEIADGVSMLEYVYTMLSASQPRFYTLLSSESTIRSATQQHSSHVLSAATRGSSFLSVQLLSESKKQATQN